MARRRGVCFWASGETPPRPRHAGDDLPPRRLREGEAAGAAARLGEQTGMSTDRIPMSKEGYEKRKSQLDKMKNEDMPRIAEQIAQARGYGDLSENAEFDAAVEAQG